MCQHKVTYNTELIGLLWAVIIRSQHCYSIPNKGLSNMSINNTSNKAVVKSVFEFTSDN